MKKIIGINNMIARNSSMRNLKKSFKREDVILKDKYNILKLKTRVL
tara:strand:+ start:250 stop:387 length:138 start_codon:yes stop_codon:yes gene_type:complete